MRPYLETMFRLPFLFIVPAIALPVLVFFGLKAMPQTYKVQAAMWVDSPATLQRNQQGQIQTASAMEAQTFRERLSTQAFRDQVIKDAGLGDAVDKLQWPKGKAPGKWLAGVPGLSPLAKALGGTDPANKDAAWKRAYAVVLGMRIKDEGNNVFTVTYVGPDGDIGQKLVNIATKDYLAEKAAANKKKIDDHNAINQAYVDAAKADVDANRAAYQDYLGTLPAEPNSNQQRRLTLLQSTYEDSLRNLQSLRLNQVQAAESTLTEVNNDSRNVVLVDAPVPGKPPVPAYGMKHTALLAIAAGFLGLALGSILIVFRTWMDRALRVTADVQLRLQAPVIGALPTVNIRQIRGDSWSAN